MNASSYIFDVTQADFPATVVDASFRQPVLVDFWAAWCQPCRMLTPLLQRLAEAYQGAFLLAKVNADREQALAQQFGIRGLPTVKVFRDGQVVDELVGVQPETAYREVIERHRVKASEYLCAQAETAWQRGKREQAVAVLRKALELEPEAHTVKLVLAEKLLALKQTDAARQLLESLPPDVRMEEAANAVFARLEFTTLVEHAPTSAALQETVLAQPDNCAARQQLGARLVLEDDYANALEQFLEILRRDPKFGDEAGRKGLLAIFAILGGDDPLTMAYRRRMFTLLH